MGALLRHVKFILVGLSVVIPANHTRRRAASMYI